MSLQTQGLSIYNQMWHYVYSALALLYMWSAGLFNLIGNAFVALVDTWLYYVDTLLELSHKVSFYLMLTREFFRYSMYNKINYNPPCADTGYYLQDMQLFALPIKKGLYEEQTAIWRT